LKHEEESKTPTE